MRSTFYEAMMCPVCLVSKMIMNAWCMCMRHSGYIIHDSRMYFISFPDSRSVYRSIHP